MKSIGRLVDWCTKNYLSINVGKCKVIPFYRIRAPVNFNYSIKGQMVSRVDEVSDLGVLMDPQLDFKAHIVHKIAKAYSMLGFLKRICASFDDLKCLSSIFKAHVRFHLEYAAAVCSLSSISLSDHIESIQKKFVLFALRRSVRRNSKYQLPPYDERRKVLGLERLSDRRKQSRIFHVRHSLSAD